MSVADLKVCTNIINVYMSLEALGYVSRLLYINVSNFDKNTEVTMVAFAHLSQTHKMVPIALTRRVLEQ